jgi:hypothetical protein
LPHITQAEAQSALDEITFDEHKKFSVVGGPDSLGAVTVYDVRVWDGEYVDFRDVMFYRKNGKVKVYEGRN